MNRFTRILWIIFLALGGCSIPPTEQITQLEPSLPIISATELSTTTPIPIKTNETPMFTQTLTDSETPTATLTPTIAIPESPYGNLPPLTVGQTLTITHINMVDYMNGWGIGHQNKTGDRILYSQDGGYSWEERTPPMMVISKPDSGTFRAWGYFLDEQIAWVIALPEQQPFPINAPVIWRTKNSGRSWEASTPLPLTGEESYFTPENFSFINPEHGWLLVHVDAGMSHDYSNLYATSDGGITWTRVIDPYGEGLQSLQNTGLAFADKNFGWVTKDNLAVLPGAFIEQTRDGGLTWEDIFLPEPEEFDWYNEISQCSTTHPTFLEGIKGVVLVNCHTFEDEFFTYTYLSSNEGKSWQSTQLPSSVKSLHFIDSKFGWAFGRDLYQSTDGGLSWVKFKSVNWDGQFSFVDNLKGWAVATSNEAIALVFTQDGGNSWQIIKTTVK